MKNIGGVRGLILVTVIFFLMFMTVSAFAGTIDLPQTGQTKCYDTGGEDFIIRRQPLVLL